MGLKLSTLFSEFFFIISSQFSLFHGSKLSFGYVSLIAINGELSIFSEILNGTKSLIFIVKKVIVVGMVFLGNFIVMNSEPPIIVFLFHASQLVVTVDFGVGLHDIPWFNRLTFVFHLDKIIADFF